MASLMIARSWLSKHLGCTKRESPTVIETGGIDCSHRSLIPHRGRQNDCAIALATSYLEHPLPGLNIPRLNKPCALFDLSPDNAEVIRLVWVDGCDAVEVIQGWGRRHRWITGYLYRSSLLKYSQYVFTPRLLRPRCQQRRFS